MTIDNRKVNADPIKRAQITEAREDKRLVFRLADLYVIRDARDRDHARWYRVQAEEVTA